MRLLLLLLPTLLTLLPEPPQAARQLGRRLALRVALVLIPLLLVLVAACFTVAALDMALADCLSPSAAVAIVALALCLLAALETVVVVALDSASQGRRAQAARDAQASLLVPLQDVGRPIGGKPLPSVLAAVVVGTVVAWVVRRR